MCFLVGWFILSTSCVLLGTSPTFNIFVFLLIKKKKKRWLRYGKLWGKKGDGTQDLEMARIEISDISADISVIYRISAFIEAIFATENRLEEKSGYVGEISPKYRSTYRRLGSRARGENLLDFSRRYIGDISEISVKYRRYIGNIGKNIEDISRYIGDISGYIGNISR